MAPCRISHISRAARLAVCGLKSSQLVILCWVQHNKNWLCTRVSAIMGKGKLLTKPTLTTGCNSHAQLQFVCEQGSIRQHLPAINLPALRWIIGTPDNTRTCRL